MKRKEAESSGKTEFAWRAAFPGQPAADLIVEVMQLCAEESQRGIQRLDRIAAMTHVRILAANSDDLKWTLIAGFAVAGLRFADKDTYRTFMSLLVDQVEHAGGNDLPDTFKLHEALWFSRKLNCGRLQTGATVGRNFLSASARARWYYPRGCRRRAVTDIDPAREAGNHHGRLI